MLNLPMMGMSRAVFSSGKWSPALADRDQSIKTPDTSEPLARLRKFRGRLPAKFRFNRLEAHEQD